jgi:hypothetical protein
VLVERLDEEAHDHRDRELIGRMLAGETFGSKTYVSRASPLDDPPSV